eukprot:3235393-Amphidinium_carterae.1
MCACRHMLAEAKLSRVPSECLSALWMCESPKWGVAGTCEWGLLFRRYLSFSRHLHRAKYARLAMMTSLLNFVPSGRCAAS